ncbi:glycosyltransferase [Alphaproteobacteria bacterium LSUCC0684]
MTGKNLHVLHVIPSLAGIHGGTTSSVLEMIDGLVERGISCDVALSDDDGPGQRLPRDAAARRIAGRHYFPKRSDIYTFTPDMTPWLKANVASYDLVHIHGLFSHVNSLAGRCARKRGIPYIVTPHGMANRYGMRHKPIRKFIAFRLMEQALLEQASAIHLTSRGEERDFADLSITTKVKMIPLAATPVPQGDPAAYRHLPSVKSSDTICLFIGRLDPIKNLEGLLEALAMPRLENFHLLVCGEGSPQYAARLKDRVRRLGIEKKVTWLGFVSGPGKADVFASSDMLVQPSFSESFGMAAIEALSSGLPCVLSRYVATAEDLVRAELAIPVGTSPRSIAAGMLLAREWKTSSFTARARQHVATCFDRSVISTAMAAFYHQTVQCSGAVEEIKS